MGLLDALKGQALGKLSEVVGQFGQDGQWAAQLLEQQGGIQGLAKLFNDKGLGNIVQSWISTGQNLPINAQQLQAALGNDSVKALAAKAGFSPDQLVQKLTQILPTLVDKLTPSGELPK